MTNIYQTLLKQDYSIQPVVVERAIVLLKMVTGLDLSGQEDSFKRGIILTSSSVTMELLFPYGTVEITATPKDRYLNVVFKFKRDLAIQFPLNAWICKVAVDHEMNFQKAFFEHYMSISRYNWDAQNQSNAYCAIKIQHVIDADLSHFNTVEYNNLFSTSHTFYEDLKNLGLNNDFFVPNIEFEHYLLKFLDLFRRVPRVFCSVFTEYPSFNSIIDHIEKAAAFLNLFHTQYTTDFELLQSRLLLVDMQEI